MLLENVPVSLDPNELIRHLRLGKYENAVRLVEELLETALPLIAPKAFYEIAYIDKKENDAVEIGGLSFRSRVLRKNLDPAERVFPFVLTIGGRVEEKAGSSGDLLRQYYLETIADLALLSAGEYFENYLKKRFGLSKISSMSPGSLPDWPVTEQKPLFALLGDAEATIGVRLTESMLMIPRKSISGIYFPTEVSFFSCQLCQRERCPGRKAVFDETLKQTYGLAEE
jgi:hypothetical protein